MSSFFRSAVIIKKSLWKLTLLKIEKKGYLKRKSHEIYIQYKLNWFISAREFITIPMSCKRFKTDLSWNDIFQLKWTIIQLYI